MPKRQYATLVNRDCPNHEVEVLEWDHLDDEIPGYVKVRNTYGWIHVVKTERLTDPRERW